MRLPGALFLPAMAAVTGCGGGGGTAPDFGADAALPEVSCEEAPAADLGRCVVPDSGVDCSGVEEETEFVLLEAGDEVDMVVGPQGATMFVLAVRCSGIDLGDGTFSENPEVRVELHHGDRNISNYQSRTPFEADPAGGTATANGLFLALAGTGEGLEGETIRAHAEVADRNGELRCADLEFIGGEVEAGGP